MAFSFNSMFKLSCALFCYSRVTVDIFNLLDDSKP